MRGAHHCVWLGDVCVHGPSPRAWGSPLPGGADHRPRRSIPTCVGLTTVCGLGTCAFTVHPHVRGAHFTAWRRRSVPTGPSPRAWGSPLRPHRIRTEQRSIPTCVGLTGERGRYRAPPPVHPHVRGAHGGPPRPGGGNLRSIPTCVGLTASSPSSSPNQPVHPHVRGAHSSSRGTFCPRRGPSPRAWGSPHPVSARNGCARSIPTCVGLTSLLLRPPNSLSVHPHVRGAHDHFSVAARPVEGPSPRAWGSHRPRPVSGFDPQVHPHVRGAHWGRTYEEKLKNRSIPTCVGLTGGAHMRRSSRTGPSPRAWGSPLHPSVGQRPPRSIPTCVGLT